MAGMRSVHIPPQLHEELKLFAIQQEQTLSETVRRLLTEALARSRAGAEQEQSLALAYQAIAPVHARLAEESAHYVVEVLDPDEEWEEYQDG